MLAKFTSRFPGLRNSTQDGFRGASLGGSYGEVEVVRPVLKVTSIASTMPIICSKSVDFKFHFPHSHDKAALKTVLCWKLFQCSYTTNVYRAGATTGIGLYSDTFPRELLPWMPALGSELLTENTQWVFQL